VCMTEMPASTALAAELVPTGRPKILVFLRSLPSLILAFVGGDAAEWKGTDLVVRRIDTGRDVLRMGGMDVEEADRLIALVRADLDTHTVESFLDEWRHRA
jgi:hypothetical protein